MKILFLVGLTFILLEMTLEGVLKTRGPGTLEPSNLSYSNVYLVSMDNDGHHCGICIPIIYYPLLAFINSYPLLSIVYLT